MSDRTSLEIFRNTLNILFKNNCNDIVILEFLFLGFNYDFYWEDLGENTLDFLYKFQLAEKTKTQDENDIYYEYDIFDKDIWIKKIESLRKNQEV